MGGYSSTVKRMESPSLSVLTIYHIIHIYISFHYNFPHAATTQQRWPSSLTLRGCFTRLWTSVPPEAQVLRRGQVAIELSKPHGRCIPRTVQSPGLSGFGPPNHLFGRMPTGWPTRRDGHSLSGLGSRVTTHPWLDRSTYRWSPGFARGPKLGRLVKRGARQPRNK